VNQFLNAEEKKTTHLLTCFLPKLIRNGTKKGGRAGKDNNPWTKEGEKKKKKKRGRGGKNDHVSLSFLNQLQRESGEESF